MLSDWLDTFALVADGDIDKNKCIVV